MALIYQIVSPISVRGSLIRQKQCLIDYVAHMNMQNERRVCALCTFLRVVQLVYKQLMSRLQVYNCMGHLIFHLSRLDRSSPRARLKELNKIWYQVYAYQQSFIKIILLHDRFSFLRLSVNHPRRFIAYCVAFHNTRPKYTKVLQSIQQK